MLAPPKYESLLPQSKWNLSPSQRAFLLRRRLARYLTVAFVLYCCYHLINQINPPRRGRIQYDFPRGKSFVQQDRQEAVKKEFLHAWDGYRDHSWMADGLMPLSGGRRTQFCSWSATLVDALDTLWIMDLQEEFHHAVNATMTIHFRDNAETCEVSLFESTIRYLGGLLGAYDLSHDPRLLDKLIEVGDMLHGAFNTSNGMPCSYCHLANSNEIFAPSDHVALADVGSLYLEFSRLSQLTGDLKYQHSIDHVLEVFNKTQNDSTVPGLWPQEVHSASIPTNESTTEEPTFARLSQQYSLGALSDSAYEYLVKGHLMLGSINELYGRMWEMAVEPIRELMLFNAHIPGLNGTEVLFSGIISKSPGLEYFDLEPRTQHLGCFAGGMFAMSSRIFDRPSDFEIGKQLTEGCVWAYAHSPTGIMPETFSLMPCDSEAVGQCAWNETLWQEAFDECVYYARCGNANMPQGYMSVMDQKYILRPEAIESVFIMWRMTGDEYWRDVGWLMFQSIIRHTRTPFGHSALLSVMYQYETEVFEEGVKVKVMRATQSDDMESFWFAETLKYFYLLFSDVNLISLDDFVLNTEAHPFRLDDKVRGF